MSVESYLYNLANSMVIRDTEKESISRSFSTLESRLKSYFGADIVKVMKFGSYTRKTILPRKFDEKSDVDVMIVFNYGSMYRPQTFLDKLKRFAFEKYSTSEIHQSSPTIMLNLNHIKFELVPAYQENVWNTDEYQIPKTPSEWMSTTPHSFDKELVKCNDINKYKVKPVIRLMKHWNIQTNKHKLSSFELERQLTTTLRFSYLSSSTYTSYLKDAFRGISSYETNTDVTNALRKIDVAISLEDDGYPHLALQTIQEVFPEK